VDASYLIVWGTNLPITRTPDAHFMTEARYRGQKVVVVSPDYSDHVKFADEWLPAQPGTDAALAMAMGHVILKELWVDRQVERFADYGTGRSGRGALALIPGSIVDLFGP
jgi:nitrate reductase alpha subunit